MKKILFFAAAILAFASCASDSFTGTDEAGRVAQSEKPISFGFDVPAATRAEGAVAAGKLNNQFIVWGEKSETADGAAPAAGNLVFPNYKVTYGTNTAYTTTSNTKDWEYVGWKWSATDAANVKIGDTPVTENDQTIKYWDYAATSYTFTAVSANPEDITAGRVVINKTTSGSDIYAKGYTVTLSKTAATGTDPDIYPRLADLYFSDRNEITKGSGKDRTAQNAYGGNVQLTFRNALSQVRVGVYETIPGYAVTAIKFYVTGDDEATNGATPTPTSAFGAIAPNIGTNYEGTLTVTYYDETDADTKNHPKLSFSGTPANDLILGTNMSTLSTSKVLGTSSASPTWDTDGGTFTSVLPQIDNTTNMKLKVDYTLWNSVTGETINIKGKTAEVPGKYLAWKPNFKYTYLFKITDDDLYPITFDAVVIEAENGEAEYITTVTEPSITTFGVKGNKYQVGKDQYEAGSDIYATIKDGTSVVDPALDTNVNVYLATTTDATNFPITEASVAESLAEISTGTKKITTTLKNSDGTTSFTAAPAKVTTVPTEDGNTTNINALKLSGAKATTETTAYVIEYIKTPATYNTTGSTYDDQSAFDAAGTLYSDADGKTVATYANSSTTYYKRVSVKNVGVYAYKVIRVSAVAP